MPQLSSRCCSTRSSCSWASSARRASTGACADGSRPTGKATPISSWKSCRAPLSAPPSTSDLIVLQLGLVGKKGLYRGVRRWLQAYGESDPDLVLEVMQDPIVRTPEQEHAMWTNGDYSAEPNLAENLAQHLAAHQALLANPAAQAMLGPASS